MLVFSRHNLCYGTGYDLLQGVSFLASIYQSFWKTHIFYSVTMLSSLALLVCPIWIIFLMERVRISPGTCILSYLFIRFALYNEHTLLQILSVTILLVIDTILLSMVIASLTQITFQFYKYRLHGLFPKS